MAGELACGWSGSVTLTLRPFLEAPLSQPAKIATGLLVGESLDQKSRTEANATSVGCRSKVLAAIFGAGAFITSKTHNNYRGCISLSALSALARRLSVPLKSFFSRRLSRASFPFTFCDNLHSTISVSDHLVGHRYDKMAAPRVSFSDKDLENGDGAPQER